MEEGFLKSTYPRVNQVTDGWRYVSEAQKKHSELVAKLLDFASDHEFCDDQAEGSFFLYFPGKAEFILDANGSVTFFVPSFFCNECEFFAHLKIHF